MKAFFNRLLIVFTGFFIYFTLFGCSTNFPKLVPEYKGVDPRVQELVDQYKELAKFQGIEFKNDVTIGFKRIKDGDAVGVTTYGWGWREIDIDSLYYENSTQISRWIIVNHELSHAYCGRKHDWAEGKNYPETAKERLKEALEWVKSGGKKPGRYEDGCPISIMYPSILDDGCVSAHYNDYVSEMFQRCNPY